MSAKSVVIASFALCGFANFSSIAIQLGGIGVLVPERKADLAQAWIQSNDLRYNGFVYFCFACRNSVIISELLHLIPSIGDLND